MQLFTLLEKLKDFSPSDTAISILYEVRYSLFNICYMMFVTVIRHE